MTKKIIALTLTFLLCVSCVTHSHSYLTRKHNENDLVILYEGKPEKSYSHYFELKKLMEFTEKGICVENFDSVRYAYWKMKHTVGMQPNCIMRKVTYKLNNDTINNIIYIIDTRYEEIVHDENILNYFASKIELNILKFVEKNKIANDTISISI